MNPGRFHLVEGAAGRLLALRVEDVLDPAEAALELGIGPPQRSLRFDLQMPGEIRDGEKQIADLLVDMVGPRFAGEFGANLRQFFLDLGGDLGGVAPVETDPRGALLQLVGAGESRQRGDYAIYG